MSEQTLPVTTPDSSGAIGVDARGQMTYPSAAESGHIEIELPSLKGSSNPTETLLAVNFGTHVAGKIASSLDRASYLKSGTQQDAAQVLRHYAAVARGSGLLDPATLKNLEVLAQEFASEPYQREYFEQVARPYLLSLTPKRR